jgi:hypothetical protein
MKKTFVNLQGGLGNQLFIYYYARYFSEQYQRKVIYLCSNRDQLFKIGIKIENESIILNKQIKKIIVSILSKLSNLKFFNAYIYIPSSIGFDNIDKNLDKTLFISGYFQTPLYFFESGSFSEISFQVSKYLDPNTSTFQKIKSDTSAGIHIRRGDYLHPKNSYFGILSPKYYINAISRLLESNKISDIYMFSDSPISSNFKINLEIRFPTLNFVDTSNLDLTDVQTLELLSQFKLIVISNSTFAWWGAFLSGNSKVYCPSKWFKQRQDPNFIYPGNWIQIESSWGKG